MPIEPKHWHSFLVEAEVSDLEGDYTLTAGHEFVTLDGRRALRQTPTLGTQRRLRRAIGAIGAGAHWSVGNRVRGTSNRPLLRWSEGDSPRLEIQFITGGIELRVGGTLVATSAPVYTPDAWQYVEVEAYVDASAGWVRVYHNREEIIAWDGDTSVLATTDTIQWTCISTGAGGSAHWTDLYVAEVVGGDVGTPGNTIGPMTAPELPPDSDASTEWDRSTGTDTHALLATQPHDGDSNYVESDTADEEDVLGIDASELADFPVLAVGVVTTARQPTEGSLQLRHGITSGATTEYGVPFHVMEGFRSRMVGRWLADPDDDEEWTKTKIDALTLRYQSRAG